MSPLQASTPQGSKTQDAKIQGALETFNNRVHDALGKRYGHGVKLPFWQAWFWVIFLRFLIFIVVIIIIYLPVPNSREETHFFEDFERLAGSAAELKDEESNL